MSLKGMLFIGVFTVCVVGALFLPHIGIYGYIADYCISPTSQWWGRPFLGMRFSFSLAAATMIGIVLNRNKLNYGEKFFCGQEITLLLFLCLIWLLYYTTSTTVGRYTVVDHPSLKFTKITIFLFMTTHVITDIKKLKGLFWVFIIVSLMLGMKAWDVPFSSFQSGRLEGIGGADFSESNFFAAFLAAMLPFIGIKFLNANIAGKLLCFVSGAFTANAIVLCRSRGAFVGLLAGALVACAYAPPKHRKSIFAILIVGMLGLGYVADTSFLERITTITSSQEQMDSSSLSRIRLWKAGGRILADHPLGIGPGNWYQTIGRYIPEYSGKDSHNTYVKCAVELGLPGITLFLIFLLQAYFNLKSVYKKIADYKGAEVDEFTQYYFAVTVSLAVILTCGLTITMIYTEIVWVLLMLPVCLKRALDNLDICKQEESKNDNVTNMPQAG